MSEEMTLEQIRTERARIKAERAKMEDDGAEARELAEEKRKLADETAMLDAEQNHGRPGVDFVGIQTPDGIVIVKKPPHGALRAFIKKDERTPEDIDRLVNPNIIYPAKAIYYELAERYGLLPVRIADALVDLGGIGFERTKGKF